MCFKMQEIDLGELFEFEGRSQMGIQQAKIVMAALDPAKHRVRVCARSKFFDGRTGQARP